MREPPLPAIFHYRHRSRSTAGEVGAGPRPGLGPQALNGPQALSGPQALNERAGISGFSPVAQPLHLMAHGEQDGHHDN